MFSSSEVAAPIAVSSPVVNRHDDDFDVDMERVLSAVMNDNANAQPTAAAADSTRPAGSSSGNPRRDVRQTSAETASPARGWDVFTQWVQRESAAQHPLPNSTAARTPTPVLALHGAASLAHHSASFDPAETTLASRALGTSTPPNASGSFHHHAGSPNYWQAMATPPRTQKSDNSVAMHSEYAYTPATVMPSQDRQSSMNQTRGFAYDETTTPGSNQRRAAVGGAIFYSLSSPTSNGAGAATQFPAPQDSPAKRLNTTAAPFTPQRYGGAGYVDPAAGASWSSPHSAGTYSTPSGYHTTLQPLTPPSASANPALTATPLGFSAAPFPIELVKSNPVAAAKDQQGCRTLQRILELQWAHPDVQEVFAGLFPSLPELMADAYGNFLVQKLLDVAPDDVRLRIAQLVSPHLAHIATTPHGTFAAQKLVDSLRSSEERTAVCEGLAGAVVALCTDHNGAHVVQKVIAAVGPDEREVLVVQVSNYIVDIAKNRYGTCIVQRCIERCVGAAVQFDALASAIVANVTPLILDPYGNYVVQRLIEQCAPRSRAIDEIVNQLTLQTVDVLKHVVTSQFSSKAVEKALQRASIAVSSAFCDALSVDGVLEDCIGDQFGNYIVQTGLGLAAAPIDHAALNSPNPRTPPVSNLSGGFTVSGSDRNTPTSKLTLPSEYTVEGTTPEQQMARVIARFVRFTSCVERNIHTVHLATFGRKMETKLDHAQRNLRVAAGRSTASTASRGTPPQPSVRGRRNTPPIATTPPAHHHQMVMHHHGPIIAAQNANAAAVSFHHHASASHPVAPLHTATTAAQQQQGVPRGTPPPEPTLRRRPPSHASSSPNSAPAS